MTNSIDEFLGEMTILDHLNEFRIRVTHAMIGLVIGAVISLLFTKQLLVILQDKYCQYFDLLNDECTLTTLAPTEGIEGYFKVALTSGLVIAMPWIVYQLWKFIAPGLYKKEKRHVLVFIPMATLLFVMGVSFAWFILLPPALQFLTGFLGDVISNEWQLSQYISFVTKFLVWIGLSFETPLIMYFLGRFGILTSETLRKNWRFAIVGIAIAAALITPSVDPVTMSLTMIPLGLLYGASIITTQIGYTKFERTGGTQEDTETKEDAS